VYGFTPTYGLVSRYGLLDYANSMDKIGIMAKDIEDVALMLQVIAGHDDKDSTSSNVKIHNYTKQEKSKFKVAVIRINWKGSRKRSY
jgi:aspartyl-tRNA(Asn)/glutamyl-tRNA(Gln) amidotransferase subunit A